MVHNKLGRGAFAFTNGTIHQHAMHVLAMEHVVDLGIVVSIPIPDRGSKSGYHLHSPIVLYNP